MDPDGDADGNSDIHRNVYLCGSCGRPDRYGRGRGGDYRLDGSRDEQRKCDLQSAERFVLADDRDRRRRRRRGPYGPAESHGSMHRPAGDLLHGQRRRWGRNVRDFQLRNLHERDLDPDLYDFADAGCRAELQALPDADPGPWRVGRDCIEDGAMGWRILNLFFFRAAFFALGFALAGGEAFSQGTSTRTRTANPTLTSPTPTRTPTEPIKIDVLFSATNKAWHYVMNPPPTGSQTTVWPWMQTLTPTPSATSTRTKTPIPVELSTPTMTQK